MIDKIRHIVCLLSGIISSNGIRAFEWIRKRKLPTILK